MSAAALPVISAIVTGVGAVMSYKSQSEAAAAQRDAARESQRIAELNAINQERETAQQAENMKKAQEREQAMNRAKASASGVAPGGSFDLVMDAQKAEHAKQLGWLKQSGKSQAEIIRRGGQLAYGQGMAQAKQSQYGAYGSLLGGIGGIADTGTRAGWFS